MAAARLMAPTQLSTAALCSACNRLAASVVACSSARALLSSAAARGVRGLVRIRRRGPPGRRRRYLPGCRMSAVIGLRSGDGVVRTVDGHLLLISLTGQSRHPSLQTFQFAGVGPQCASYDRPCGGRAVQVRRQLTVQPVSIALGLVTLKVAGIDSPEVGRGTRGLVHRRPTSLLPTTRSQRRRRRECKPAQPRTHPCLAKGGLQQGFPSNTRDGRDEFTVANTASDKGSRSRMWITAADGVRLRPPTCAPVASSRAPPAAARTGTGPGDPSNG